MTIECAEPTWRAMLAVGVVAGLAAGMVGALVVATIEGIHTRARDRYEGVEP